MSAPRVVICTAHTSDFLPLAEVTVPTIHAYAERHGYTFVYVPDWEKHIPNDGDRMKVRLYKDLYERGEWDVFFWIDADALVTNPEVTVDGLLTKLGIGDETHFLWGYDVTSPNSGVYLARFTPEAHAFMHAQFNRSIEMGWGDNTAMLNVSLFSPHKHFVRDVPGRFLNAYMYDLYGWQLYNEIGDWRTARAAGDDFILHFPGIEQAKRIELAKAIIKEIYA